MIMQFPVMLWLLIQQTNYLVKNVFLKNCVRGVRRITSFFKYYHVEKDTNTKCKWIVYGLKKCTYVQKMQCAKLKCMFYVIFLIQIFSNAKQNAFEMHEKLKKLNIILYVEQHMNKLIQSKVK